MKVFVENAFHRFNNKIDLVLRDVKQNNLFNLDNKIVKLNRNFKKLYFDALKRPAIKF